MNKPQPNWQPISSLPMIISMIGGQLEEAKIQFENFLKAKNKPYILDNALIDRTINAYKEQLDFLWVFEKQLDKWVEEEKLTAKEQSVINIAQEQLKELKEILVAILALAEKIKMGTIEKVLEKSDLEVGIEFWGEPR